MNFFKKLATKGDAGSPNQPASVCAMSSNLQRKFARGCNYNMKVGREVVVLVVMVWWRWWWLVVQAHPAWRLQVVEVVVGGASTSRWWCVGSGTRGSRRCWRGCRANPS